LLLFTELKEEEGVSIGTPFNYEVSFAYLLVTLLRQRKKKEYLLVLLLIGSAAAAPQ
jgi:hypothetical protein